MGHCLVQQLQIRVSEFARGKVTRIQYTDNFRTPAIKIAFGQTTFNFAVSRHWNRTRFELKVQPTKNAIKEKQKTIFFKKTVVQNFEYVIIASTNNI